MDSVYCMKTDKVTLESNCSVKNATVDIKSVTKSIQSRIDLYYQFQN